MTVEKTVTICPTYIIFPYKINFYSEFRGELKDLFKIYIVGIDWVVVEFNILFDSNGNTEKDARRFMT